MENEKKSDSHKEGGFFRYFLLSFVYITNIYTPGTVGVEPVRRAGGRSFFGLSSGCSFCHPSHGVLATQNMRIY